MIYYTEKGVNLKQLAKTDNFLLDGNIHKNIMILAWPAIIEMLMATLVQFVDTAMVSQLGPSVIAAVAVNMSPTMLLSALFAGVGVGTTALVARHFGADEKKDAVLVSKQSVVLGVFGALVLTTLVLIFGRSIPLLMGARPDVVPLAAVYLRILSLGFMPMFTSFIAASALRGAGDTKTPMRANIIANIINIAGNFFLIFPSRIINILGLRIPVWGADMGISGAALSTSAARAVAGIIIVGALFSGRTHIRLTLKESYKPDLAIIKKVIRIGFPTAMERFVLSMGQVFLTRIVASLGTIQLAAHHIAIVAEAISYMPGFGFAIAATTLVGQMLGAKRPDKAEKYAYETLKISVVVMTAMGVILFLFPHQLMRIFTDDPDVIRYGAVCLRIVAFSQPFFASGMVQAGALRGAGDTKWPLYITIISMWGIRLSVAWFLVYVMDMGLTGAWLSITLDLTVRGILMFIRFRKGKWKRIDL